MKKLAFTGFIAASVLLMTGCSEDNTLTQQPTEGGNVTFTVSLPTNSSMPSTTPTTIRS